MTNSSRNLFIAESFTSAVLHGIAVFKSGSNDNTISNSAFAQPQSASLAVDPGLTVNLRGQHLRPLIRHEV